MYVKSHFLCILACFGIMPSPSNLRAIFSCKTGWNYRSVQTLWIHRLNTHRGPGHWLPCQMYSALLVYIAYICTNCMCIGLVIKNPQDAPLCGHFEFMWCMYSWKKTEKGAGIPPSSVYKILEIHLQKNSFRHFELCSSKVKTQNRGRIQLLCSLKFRMDNNKTTKKATSMSQWGMANYSRFQACNQQLARHWVSIKCIFLEIFHGEGCTGIGKSLCIFTVKTMTLLRKRCIRHWHVVIISLLCNAVCIDFGFKR